MSDPERITDGFKSRVSEAVHNWIFDKTVQHALDEDVKDIALLPDTSDNEPPYVSYSEAVSATHDNCSADIEALILGRKIKPQFAMPRLGDLTDSILDLEPFYKKMQKIGLNPEVIFAPNVASLAFSDMLIAGRSVPYKAIRKGQYAIIDRSNLAPVFGQGEVPVTTQGLQANYHFFNRYEPNYFSQSEPSHDADDVEEEVDIDEMIGWNMSIVSGKNAAVSNISADGESGVARIRDLRDKLGIKSMFTDEQAVALLSPGFHIYTALQWARLMRGSNPVDITTQSILRERASKRTVVMGGWDVRRASLTAGITDPAYSDQRSGLRPTIRHKDLQYLGH